MSAYNEGEIDENVEVVWKYRRRPWREIMNFHPTAKALRLSKADERMKGEHPKHLSLHQ